MSVSLSMIEMRCPCASSDCTAICPKRPKPMTRIRSCRSSAISTPSIEGAFLGRKQSAITVNGVSTIDMMTVAVKMALCGPSITPAEAAAE